MKKFLKILNLVTLVIFLFFVFMALDGESFRLYDFEFLIFSIIGVVYTSANYYYIKNSENKEDFISLWLKLRRKKLKKELKDLDD